MDGLESSLDAYDEIVIIGENGVIVAYSDQYPKGSIEKTVENTAFAKGSVVDITAFQIRGDDVGLSIFEFLSDHLSNEKIV